MFTENTLTDCNCFHESLPASDNQKQLNQRESHLDGTKLQFYSTMYTCKHKDKQQVIINIRCAGI